MIVERRIERCFNCGAVAEVEVDEDGTPTYTATPSPAELIDGLDEAIELAEQSGRSVSAAHLRDLRRRLREEAS